MGEHLEVTVAPLQGCFFAGERFTAHVTFTNTMKAETSSGSSPLGLHTKGHRSALSLSLSSPIKPMTAPPAPISQHHHHLAGELDSQRPRTPLSASFAALPKEVQDGAMMPLRRGLVGKNPQIIAAKANRGKQAHVDPQLYASKRAPAKARHKKHNYSMAYAASSTGDLNDLSAQHAVDLYGLGHNESIDSLVVEGISDYAQSQRNPRVMVDSPNQRGVSLSQHHPSPSSSTPRSANISILWSFAQLQGSFEVDDTLIKPAEFNAVKRSLFAESSLVGGGSLDAPPPDMGWRDWLWWSSSTSQADAGQHADGHGPSVSGGVQGGWTLADRRSRALADRTVPILLIPPTLFATDLVLKPGESKTCARTGRFIP